MVSESENSNVSRYFKLLLWLVVLLIGCLLKYIPIFLEKIIEIQTQKIGDEAEKKSKLLSRMLSYAVSNYEQRNRLWAQPSRERCHFVFQGQIGAIVSQIYKIANNNMCAFAARTAAYLSIASIAQENYLEYPTRQLSNIGKYCRLSYFHSLIYPPILTTPFLVDTAS